MQVKSMAASGVASFAVLTDGTVWGWGSSKRGQLGLGPGLVQALHPQRLPGLEGITSVSAGWGHACALRGAALPRAASQKRPDQEIHCENCNPYLRFTFCSDGCCTFKMVTSCRHTSPLKGNKECAPHPPHRS